MITHGPYAWVRHPSYTGIYGTLLGASAVLLGPGTWMMDCGPAKSGGFGNGMVTAMLMLWVAWCLFVFKSTKTRAEVEDRILHDMFGEKWEAYVREVPRRFLPGVL